MALLTAFFPRRWRKLLRINDGGSIVALIFFLDSVQIMQGTQPTATAHKTTVKITENYPVALEWE